MGVTIHYVDASMDGGRIIGSARLRGAPQWSKEEIEAQVHAIEHVLYPETLKTLVEE